MTGQKPEWEVLGMIDLKEVAEAIVRAIPRLPSQRWSATSRTGGSATSSRPWPSCRSGLLPVRGPSRDARTQRDSASRTPSRHDAAIPGPGTSRGAAGGRGAGRNQHRGTRAHGGRESRIGT